MTDYIKTFKEAVSDLTIHLNTLKYFYLFDEGGLMTRLAVRSMSLRWEPYGVGLD